MDRYLALFFPFSYDTWVTKRRIIITVATSWAVWLVVDLCAFYLRPPQFVVYFFSIMISSTLVLATVVYWKIFIMARRHRQSIKMQRQAAGQDTTELEGEYRIISRTLLIVIVMFFCYAPSFAFLVVNLVDPLVSKLSVLFMRASIT